jgi:hypothetical protein
MGKSPRDKLAELVEDADACTAMAQKLLPVIWKSTVPILVEQNEVYRQHGTGTLLAIAERRFLVTAAHVYRDAFDHKLDLFLGNGPNGGKGLMRLEGNFHCTSATGIDGDEGVFDIAIRELDPEIILHLGDLTYIRLIDVAFDQHYGEDIYCVAGFPTCLATELKEGQPSGQFTRLYCLTYPLKDPSTLSGYLATHHIVLEAKKSKAVSIGEMEIPMPSDFGGFSGCSIWKTNFANTPREKWTPDCAKIVAVQTSVYRTTEAIKGTTWKAVAAMICKAYPELRPSFNLVIPRRGT